MPGEVVVMMYHATTVLYEIILAHICPVRLIDVDKHHACPKWTKWTVNSYHLKRSVGQNLKKNKIKKPVDLTSAYLAF